MQPFAFRLLGSGPASDFHPAGIDGTDDFTRRYKGTRVVWDVDFERGVHVFIGVARSRVLHHGDLIAELGGIANGGLHAGVRDQPHDDEFVNAVFLELQIQIRVGETAGTPMLRSHDIARARFKTGADLAAP